MTTAGRLCRANIRPLLLSAPGSPTTIAKHVYDVLGTIITALILNFAATPFMLLGIGDSLVAWQRLGWYGIWIVGGGLVFFYAGGQKMLKRMQVMRSSGEGKAKSGTLTPSESFQLPPALDQVVPPQA